jgi:hypothetical protein
MCVKSVASGLSVLEFPRYSDFLKLLRAEAPDVLRVVTHDLGVWVLRLVESSNLARKLKVN